MGYPTYDNCSASQTFMCDRAAAAHRNSKAKGWWSDEDLERARNLDPELLAAKIALIHSEASEALEVVRKAPDDELRGELAKELADIVIRVFDLAEACGIWIEAAVHNKQLENEHRPHRHGGRRL